MRLKEQFVRWPDGLVLYMESCLIEARDDHNGQGPTSMDDLDRRFLGWLGHATMRRDESTPIRTPDGQPPGNLGTDLPWD